jgi:hypothetical protein
LYVGPDKLISKNVTALHLVGEFGGGYSVRCSAFYRGNSGETFSNLAKNWETSLGSLIRRPDNAIQRIVTFPTVVKMPEKLQNYTFSKACF